MLSSSKTYSVLPAADLSRAVEWFRDKLELEPEDLSEQGARYTTGGDSWIYIYETANAGTAQNTSLCWLVDDIAAEMEHLRGRGVVFADYDFPGLKTENGVATDDQGKSAWFQDSEGNYLCLTQPNTPM